MAISRTENFTQFPENSIPLAGVIGYPIQHSLSPQIFQWLSQKEKKALSYHRIPVEGTLPSFRALEWMLRTLPFVGVNVTLPLKEAVQKFLDEISEEAQAIGAVNVVHVTQNGKFLGLNTDVFGILESLRESGAAKTIPGQEVLILGAGGAARAACYAVGKLKASQVSILNRTKSRAQKLCREYQELFPKTRFKAISADTGSAESPILTIQATSLGMMGAIRNRNSHKEHPSQFIFQPSSRKTWAFEMVYRPLRTPFLTEAERKGVRTIEGLDMLIWQALATWEIWFGPLTEVRKRRLKAELKTDLQTRLGQT